MMTEFVVHSLSRLAVACQPQGFKLIPTWYQYLESSSVAGKCSPIFSFPGDIPNVFLAITDILLRVGALVTVGFIIYGGFRYILSQGDPESAKNARQTIINALIGLVITIVATTAVTFVGNALASSTSISPSASPVINESPPPGT